MTYIWQVDMISGQVAHCYRRDVDDDLLAKCRSMIDAIEHGGRVPVTDGIQLTGGAHGTNLVVSVQSGRDPACTIGIALRPRAAPQLWDLMHETAVPVAAHRHSRPRCPWVASRLEAGHVEMADQLEGLAPALAWAWLEYFDGPTC